MGYMVPMMEQSCSLPSYQIGYRMSSSCSISSCSMGNCGSPSIMGVECDDGFEMSGSIGCGECDESGEVELTGCVPSAPVDPCANGGCQQPEADPCANGGCAMDPCANGGCDDPCANGGCDDPCATGGCDTGAQSAPAVSFDADDVSVSIDNCFEDGFDMDYNFHGAPDGTMLHYYIAESCGGGCEDPTVGDIIDGIGAVCYGSYDCVDELDHTESVNCNLDASSEYKLYIAQSSDCCDAEVIYSGMTMVVNTGSYQTFQGTGVAYDSVAEAQYGYDVTGYSTGGSAGGSSSAGSSSSSSSGGSSSSSSSSGSSSSEGGDESDSEGTGGGGA